MSAMHPLPPREGATPRRRIGQLQHGETALFASSGDSEPVKVSYHERQSYGDNNKRVAGAYTGEYTVQYPNGRTTTHEHGPYAKTERAASRGASRDSKMWAADRAHNEVVQHFHSASLGFNDRRT